MAMSTISARFAFVKIIFCLVSPVTTSSLGSSALKERTLNGSDLVASQILETPLQYEFPNIALGNSPNLFPMAQCNGLTLEEATIDQLQDYMSHDRLTSSQLVMCYLQRVYQTDDYIKYVSSSCNFCTSRALSSTLQLEYRAFRTNIDLSLKCHPGAQSRLYANRG